MLILALALAGCYHPGRGLKSCRYHFRELAFAGLDGSATHWNLRLGIANPNTHEVSLSRMRFTLLHEADTLISGWNPEEHVIPAGDSVTVAATLDLPNAVLQRLPPGIWSRSDAEFRLVGDAYLHTWLGNLTVPGAVDQTVHVDMTKQMARLRELLMRKMFDWQKLLRQGGVPGPATAPPGPGDAPL